MKHDEYKDKRLQVTGIEVIGDSRVSAQGTRVRLNNGMYLSDVQDISLNANHGDMWTVDVTVRTRITSQQVLELFGKIGDETSAASTETAGSKANAVNQT